MAKNNSHIQVSSRLPSIIVAATCLVVTMVAWRLVYTQETARAETRFQTQAHNLLREFESRFESYERVLDSSCGLFVASNLVSRDEWAKYVAVLETEKNYPGLIALSYAQVVEETEVQDFIETVRDEGFASYTIKSPPGGDALPYGSQRWAIKYTEPAAINKNLLGLDARRQPVLRKASDIALQQDRSAITDPLPLVPRGSDIKKTGMVMIQPLYESGLPTDNAEQRRAALSGWIFLSLSIEGLFDGFPSEVWGDYSLELVRENQSHDSAFAHSGALNIQAGGPSPRGAATKFIAESAFEIAGEPIRARVKPRTGAASHFNSHIVGATLGIGFIASFMITAIVWTLCTTRERAIKIALNMTNTLRDKELRLERMAQRADAANKSKSEFLANMSHEIRTPMTAVLGFTEVLEERFERGDTVAGCKAVAETIRRNGEHLLAIINDILDLSKIEASAIEAEIAPTSPSLLMRELLEMFEGRAKQRNIKLSHEFVTPLPAQFKSDPVRLRQILLNLLGNATKFTDHGEVGIRSRWCEAERTLTFEVWDTGVGLSDEQIDRLFKPFSQVDASAARRHGGTGLGLAISQRLAKILGGEVTVTSQVGKGSRFTLTLQDIEVVGENMISEFPQRSNIDRRLSEPVQQFQCRVLVAEDGVDNRRLIQYMLKGMGVEAVFVENGVEAVDQILGSGTTSEEFDVILMDMQMPQMDGYEATRRLRDAGYRRPIVALTAHAMKGDREKCVLAGCDDYIAKPIDRRRLAAVLRERSSPSKNAA